MSTFDFENFNYEQVKEEVKNSIKKPNILLCGATGVGKSSLVNDLFELDTTANDAAVIGNNGRPETRGVKRFTTDASTVNLYDSEGYEVGKVDLSHEDRYYQEIISYIDKLRNENPGVMENHIHEVWYCVSAGNKRFFDIDKKIIETVQKKNVPVMVLVTKVDDVDEDELNQLIYEIRRAVPAVNIYTYSTMIDSSDEEIYKKYVQRSEIIKWAIDHLDESLQLGLLPAVKGCLQEKRETIIKVCVPNHVGMAVIAVVGSSFVPVPFSDSVPLMGIQIKMAMSIFNAFNINANVKNVVSDLVGTTLVSYIGKTVAAQIISWLPGIGSVAKAAVNTTVAASVTAMLGVGITLIAEKYLLACIEKGGAENLPFAEFLTKERFSDTMTYVKNHKDEFGIDDIVKSILNKYNK